MARKHWSEILECSCGMRFRNISQEAVHRHNFPAMCRRPKVEKKCGTCKFLKVLPDNDDKVRIRKDRAYLCTVEVPWPPMPASINIEQHRHNQLPRPTHMEPHLGTECHYWESRK